MVWFKVDDKLHSHSKVRKVLAEEPAALALWVVAGSWSADNLTDGLIPDHQLPWLIPAGADELAQKLVIARLWRRVRGGYQFHEWDADASGTRRNPTRSEVEAERRKKVEAGRKGGLASGKTRSNREAPALAPASAGGSRVLEHPTRPDPVLKDSSTRSPEKKNSSRSRTDEPTRVDVEQICRHLAEQIVANGSKRPTITAEWRRQARLLLDEERADPTSVRQVVNLIDWCQRDPFWRSNIQSMPTFRRQYDQLRLKALAEAEAKKESQSGVRHVDDKTAEQRREQNPFRGMVRGSEAVRESS